LGKAVFPVPEPLIEGLKEATMKKLILSAVLAAATLGAVTAAVAQPPPPGWVGQHYFWHGQHYHHRAWAWDNHHRRYYRYW
jgi:hypothetical protein